MRAIHRQPMSEPALIAACWASLLLTALLCAVFAPPLLGLVVAAGAIGGVGFLAYRFNPGCCAVWLVLTGASLEMAASDIIGPQAFYPTIAIAKGLGIALAALAILRYGPRLDLLNPAWAWVAMFVTGLAHGLWPGMTVVDSLRSLVGSVAPFAFGFSRLSRAWSQTIIRATVVAPLLSVGAGAVLDGAGLRPLFIESGGWRLAGLGHPAFLAGVCQTATYAALLELYRTGRHRDAVLLAANLLLLLLTGARAPLTLALAVVGLSLILVPSPALPVRLRLLGVLGGAALVPVAAVLLLGLVPNELDEVRAFQVLTENVADLSGRLLLWPRFEQAAAGSWWVGWGVGAGNAILPPEGPVAQLLHTRAAHNEYLRVAAEGGQLGRALLILMFVLWVRQRTAPLAPWDRAIMRLVFLAFAIHAVTDNLLISTPACVFFAFVAAVFARGSPGASDPPADQAITLAARSSASVSAS